MGISQPRIYHRGSVCPLRGSAYAFYPRRNWDKLTAYFRYDKAIRRLVYTTNTIEGFHRQVRKVTKTKGAFTSDMALLKLVYLAHGNIKKKWTMPLANWAETSQRLAVWFPGRMVLDLP